MTVRTIKRNTVDLRLRQITSEIQKKLESLIDQKHHFSFGNRTSQTQPIDIVRWVSEMSSVTSESRHLKNIILSALSDAENTQGGSAVVCLVVLCHLMNRPGSVWSPEVSGGIENELKQLAKNYARRSSSSAVLKILANFDRDPISFRIAKKAIAISGANSTIQVISEGKNTQITSISGYKFPIEFPDVFLSASGITAEKKFDECRVMAIDGIVESMSEINGIVHESYNKNIPLVIAARGFNKDVLNTLGINFYHSRLRVFPVVVPYDATGANMINDICVVSGCDLISALKGDLISSKTWEDLGRVQSIKLLFDRSNIVLVNSETQRSIERHRRHLRKMKIESMDSLKSEVLEKRLATLVGSGTIVCLGEDLEDLRGLYSDRVNCHIRSFKSGAKFGIVDLSDLIQNIESHELKRILSSLKNLSQFFLTSQLISGFKHAVSCEKNLRSIGGMICNDNTRNN
jgi:hypothetical protein